MLTYCEIDSPIGRLRVACEDGRAVKLALPGGKIEFFHWCEKKLGRRPQPGESLPAVEQALANYFSGKNTRINFPHQIIGSPFLHQVLAKMRLVAYGKTRLS